MVIHDIQRIAVFTIFHTELAFEIRLPHLIAPLFFEADKRLPFLGFFRADAAVAVEDVVNGLGAGDAQMSFCQKDIPDRPGAPAGILRSDGQDEKLHLFRRPGRACVGPPASVCQRLLIFVTVEPLVPGSARDPVLPAQGTEIVAVHGCLCKFYSLVFHSSTLPRHLKHSFCAFFDAFILL